MEKFINSKIDYAIPQDLYGFDPSRAKSIETDELALFLEEQVIPHVQKVVRIDERVKIIDEKMEKAKLKVRDLHTAEKGPAMKKQLDKLKALDHQKLMLLQEKTVTTKEPEKE